MFKTRLIIVGLAVAIVAGVVLFVGLAFGWLPMMNSATRIQNTATILKQVQPLADLVTVKYVLEKVVIVEDVKWYGENRLLLVAHGVVKAGVDLEQLKPEHIRVSDKTAVIALPRARITDAYLDDQRTRVVDRATGLLRAFDKNLEQDARRQAVVDLHRAARYNGIIEEAEVRAKLQLTALFRQLGYDVEFEAPK